MSPCLRKGLLPQESLAHWLADVFPDISQFRQLLQGTPHAAADRAVRFENGKLYYSELVGALDRRGQIDREFFGALVAQENLTADTRRELQRIAESFGIVITPLPAVREDLLLPFEQLRELERVLSNFTIPLNVLAYGTQYRDLLIPRDGDNAYRVIESLASNPDPDAPEALRWFLERLLEFDSPDPSRDAIKNALRMVQGLTEPAHEMDDSHRVPFVMPQDSTPIDVFRRYMTAAAAVVRISQVFADRPPEFRATGWLLSPGLVVFPAHCIVLEASGGFRRRNEEEEINELKNQWNVEFESGEQGSGHVEQYDEKLDLALLRVDFSASALPLQISPQRRSCRA